MHLKCIKLAGFKSFVDPTTVSFPSHLCAVVGPNGCGKSNIIDAVRWVMGESSAKHLRGESMADVIFNGSGGRKPVGQASIELVFDNSDTTLGGEYAAYSEISIRRKVTRDGQSNYYLNGNKCRRRDITDVFLGTGLGPRSYAIIEQGMISHLIESKPDELRIYIEEAAGISKYRERRKETESRIARTQENLERLTDIRDELGRQLQRLERQAQAAARYTEFRREERELRAQLLALRWRGYDREVTVGQRAIAAEEIRVEALLAERSGCDTQLERQRLEHSAQTDSFNQTQGRYYAVGAEVARLEQGIRHARDRAVELQRDLDDTARNSAESAEHLRADRQKAVGWEAELREIEPDLATAREQEAAATESLQTAEAAMLQWQRLWDEFNETAAAPRRQAEVQQSRIRHLEQALQRLGERIDKLTRDQATLAATPATDDSSRLLDELTAAEALAADHQIRLQEVTAAIDGERKVTIDIAGQLAGARDRMHRLRGRQSSLEALQQAAMTGDKGVSHWLLDQSLGQKPRIADTIQVAEGWETAVEAVLGSDLQAVCVEDLGAHLPALADVKSGNLALVETNAAASGSAAGPAMGELLAGHVGSGPAHPLLAGIRVADDVAEAMALRPELAHTDSIVTRDGLWFGRHWVRVARGSDSGAGVLDRKRELAEVGREIESTATSIDTLSAQQSAVAAQLTSMEGTRDTLAREIATQQRYYADTRARLSACRTQAEQLAARQETLLRDLAEADDQRQHELAGLTEARHLLEQALDAMGRDNDRRQQLHAERDDCRTKLEAARVEARTHRDRVHALALREQAVRAQLVSVRAGIERLDGQVIRLRERQAALASSLEQQCEPEHRLTAELQQKLALRLQAEAELTAARTALETIEQSIRQVEHRRSGLEQELLTQRGVLEQQRLATQEIATRCNTLSEQIAEQNFELPALLALLPEDANHGQWEQRLAQVEARIQRLGPINLAAMDEFQTESERKGYLDAQHDELVEALTALDEAIRKIDRETRTRFKKTFDQVNATLQVLFPKLFGGGDAYLEMTDSDLLNAGVTVMARPPGKKNSTIHLLSGGEKALTAVALVFAIFQLNPAPFCMLDEVDAPLDDANVVRYTQLVKEMSAKIQFIYITHNKIAMEMAHQLMGVTMSEPGVSRLVSVDVDRAVQLAGA